MTLALVVRRAGTPAGVVLAFVWVWFAPFSVLGSANLALFYALIGISLVMLIGWVGQISLAQASFVGVGAFVTAVAVEDWGIQFPLTLPVAAMVAAGMAALLGLVALRVRGLYLAVATLIFAWMAQEYLFNQPWLAGVGGSASALADPLGEAGTVPYIDFTDRKTFYYVLLIAVSATLIAGANLRDSKTGRAWFAVKGSEVAAASLGVDVTRAKILAFAVSGFIAGMAGNLFMTYQQVTTVEQFSVERSLFFLAIAVVGGLSRLGGAVAAGILFASLEELFFRVDALAGFLQLVSACLLVVVLLFFPAGLAGVPPRVASACARGAESRVVQRVRHSLRRAISWRAGPEKAVHEPPDGIAAVVSADDLAPPADEVVTDGTTAWRARWLEAVRRLTGLRADDDDEAPDQLALSLEPPLQDGGEPSVELGKHGPDDEGQRSPALGYVPGTATKVRLPSRRRRETVLGTRNITVRFGGLTAVDDYSLDVRRNEIVGLIGPNGAGKTTLFNAISGLNEPTGGTVELFGRDLTALPVHERARRGMGRTFQAIQLFRELSVFDNLMVATHDRNKSGFLSHMTASPLGVTAEAEARARVHRVVDLLSLGDFVGRSVADLPFGVLRMVELARALVTGAPFVMLDEPASGLDNAETDRFMDLLLWARQTLGISLLLIEHDVRVVMALSDYVYVIDQGRKIAEGTPAQVQGDEAVIAAYLGSGAVAEYSGGSRKAGGAMRVPVR